MTRRNQPSGVKERFSYIQTDWKKCSRGTKKYVAITEYKNMEY